MVLCLLDGHPFLMTTRWLLENLQVPEIWRVAIRLIQSVDGLSLTINIDSGVSLLLAFLLHLELLVARLLHPE